jgi:hypothetical protein
MTTVGETSMPRETQAVAIEEQVELFSPMPPQPPAVASYPHVSTSELLRNIGGGVYQRRGARQHDLQARMALKATVATTITTPVLIVLVGFIAAYLPPYLAISITATCTGCWITAIRILYRAYRSSAEEAHIRARAAARFDILSGAVLLAPDDESRAEIALTLVRGREFSERIGRGETTEYLELRKLARRRARRRSSPAIPARGSSDPVGSADRDADSQLSAALVPPSSPLSRG